MFIDRRRLREASRIVVAAWALTTCGCRGRGDASHELVGPDALARLPREVALLIPEDVVLCLDETRRGGSYRLWILRRPGRDWLGFQGAPKGMERHRTPASALESILQARLPSLRRGRPLEPHCRFTHWRLADGTEVQIRESITEQGWFASVERVAM